MVHRLATAEWADPDIIERELKYQEGTFWLGRSPVGYNRAIGYNDDRHICLVSGTRGGKGTTSIIPNICLWPGSIVVVDPKGENATITAARRGPGSEHSEGMGQAVHVLDPFKAAQVGNALRSRFNPLDSLDPAQDETIDEAARLAEAIVVRQNTSQPFWEESARLMVKGLILHILTAPEYEGRRNLITLRQLILRGDWEAIEFLKTEGETEIPTGQEMLWEGVSRNTAFNGLIAGIGDQYRNMAITAGKQFEGVLQVANLNTEFIDSPGMQECLSASDFSLAELKTNGNGMSLYLSLPQRYMPTHYRWLRMMISLVISEMEIIRRKPITGHPVLLCLDEFAGLKRLEVIENAAAQIAGYGVKLLFVLQSLEQLKSTYKNNWETFLSNSGLKVFFGIEDHFSRDYLSKLIGETEVIREMRSASESQSQSHSTAHSESYSVSRSTSESSSYSRSVSKSVSDSVNSSSSSSRGGSSGLSWKPQFLFYEDKRKNRGRNWSRGKSSGNSKGRSKSSTDGVSQTQGSSISETYGVTNTTTYGSSQSQTDGRSESLHKRPLITPDEIGKMFTRVDDPEHPAYPGLALVLMTGVPPVAVKKVNYYEDIFFDRLFDYHPDHDKPQVTTDVPVYFPTSNLLKYISFFGTRANYPYREWHVTRGSYVRATDPLVTFCGLANTGKYKRHVREGGQENELLMVSPVTGIVKAVNDRPEDKSPAIIISTREEWPPPYYHPLHDSHNDNYEEKSYYLGFYENGYYSVQYAHDLNAYIIEDWYEKARKRMLALIGAALLSLFLLKISWWFILLTIGLASVAKEAFDESNAYKEKMAEFDALRLPP